MAGKLDPKQLAQVGATNGQALVYNTANNKWQPGSVAGGLGSKAGNVLAAAFSGNTKTAAVTFTTAFANANYAIVLTVNATGHTGFGPGWTDKTVNGFTIDMNSNNICKLVSVDWIAVAYGET